MSPVVKDAELRRMKRIYWFEVATVIIAFGVLLPGLIWMGWYF